MERDCSPLFSESFHCFDSKVKKIPFALDCVDMTYDITRPQPQLYVTPDFASLTRVLDDLGATMAFRRGGKEGLSKAQKAGTVTTTVFESEIQISGVLAGVIPTNSGDPHGEPCYLQFKGPTQLSHGGREIANQGPSYHREGFGTPLGKIKGSGKSPADLTESEFKSGRIEFESGVIVEGKYLSKLSRDGKTLIASFEQCTVKKGSQILFSPDWGTFDMACGERAVSVHAGAADIKRYLAATGGFKQVPGRPKTNLTAENRDLNDLYGRVRKVREDIGSKPSLSYQAELESIHASLEKKYPDDWLLRFELLELSNDNQLNLICEKTLRHRLTKIAATDKDRAEMIGRGLELLK